MCLNPSYIKNVNHFRRTTGLNALNINTEYIAVPCGVCASCVALKQSFLIQRCQLETFDNDLWFCTLTYNNESLPQMTVNGRKIRYALKSDFINFIKILRKYDVFGSTFRYLAVSEFGSVTHRPHWHIIFSTPKSNLSFSELLSKERKLYDLILHYWRRNYGSRRAPIWKPLLTFKSCGRKRNYDFHYVIPSLTQSGEDDVGFYVTKYVLKFDDYVKRLKSALYFNLNSDEFKKIWSEVKPHFFISKGFGDIKNPKVIEYVNKCISTSVNGDSYKYPVFINPISGQEFPLSPYLRNKFLSVSDAYIFYEKQGALNFRDIEELNKHEYDNKQLSLEKRRKVVSSRNNCDTLSDDSFFDSYESPICSIKFLQPWLDFSPNFEDFDNL